ncbi:unnamed protein product [Lupinus luteus]|uniref:Uncharacterized protein n=1 Tax=Lupinus luteus TaxID=3873 RepID=A0AAV1YLT1_LUPLU
MESNNLHHLQQEQPHPLETSSLTSSSNGSLGGDGIKFYHYDEVYDHKNKAIDWMITKIMVKWSMTIKIKQLIG